MVPPMRVILSDVLLAVLACFRAMGVFISGEGDVNVLFDNLVIQDTDAEKERDMKEVVVS